VAELTLRIADAAALRALFDAQLAKRRAFLAGEGGVEAPSSCTLVVACGDRSCAVVAEIVYVRAEDPGRGVGVQLAEDAVAPLRAFVEECEAQTPPEIADEPTEEEAKEDGANEDPGEAPLRMHERVRSLLAKIERTRGVPQTLGVVHRIDKETSGLVVFTRTWLAKKSLSSQFRAHTVHRRYLAIAHGRVRAQTIRTHLVEDRGDGRRGSIEHTKRGGREGQLAITHVEPIEALEGATLVACRLETGRTHQIRIHLSEAGHPIVGERVYMKPRPDAIHAPRLMLHAAELGFVHPATGRAMKWETLPPADFNAVLTRLRLR